MLVEVLFPLLITIVLDLLQRQQIQEEGMEDLENNPESDSYQFMQFIIESFFLLERLPEAVQAILDRASLEVFNVVEREIHIAAQQFGFINEKGETIKVNVDPSKESTIMLEFMSVLYGKLECIIAAHSHIINVIKSIQLVNLLSI